MDFCDLCGNFLKGTGWNKEIVILDCDQGDMFCYECAEEIISY